MYCMLAHLTNPAQPRVEADVVTHRLVMCGSSINHHSISTQHSTAQQAVLASLLSDDATLLCTALLCSCETLPS